MTSYYKVQVEKPKFGIPGYLTRLHGIIYGYLSAFLDSAKNSDDIVYVVEVNIDIRRLKVIYGVTFGYNKSGLLPGYVGNEPIPDEGIDDPLDVIVWNEPIGIQAVGAYVKKYNVDPTKPYSSGRYISNGNAWLDSERGSYSFKDLDTLNSESAVSNESQIIISNMITEDPDIFE